MADSNLQLDTLEAKGLIRLAAFNPELEYLFRHALVQDTAYESLLKQERRSLHRLVGDALEELYPERHADLAAVLAMHFEQAGDTERAVTYLMAAARFAYERNAVVEAFDLYGRAAAMLPEKSDDEDQATLRRRVEIAIGQAKSGFAFQNRTEAISLLEVSIADAERLGDPRLIAEAYLYSALMRQMEGERVDTSPALKHSLDRITEAATELNDPQIAALPRSIIGLTQVFAGEMREGVAALEEAAPMLEATRDFVGSSFALMSIGVGYARLGEFAKADAAVEHAKKVAEGGDIIARLDTLIGASMVAVQHGDLEAAVPLATQCTTMAEDAGATACVVASNLVLGESLYRQGQFGGAKIALDRSNEVAEVTNQRMFRPSLVAYRQSVAAAMGDLNLRGRTFEQALDEANEMGDRWAEATIHWRRAVAEEGKDIRDSALLQSDFETADREFADMGARPSLARVERDWGHALVAEGQREAGEAKYQSALKLFDEMGLTREAAEVREELASLS